jgi:hypothetical protein
MIRFFYFLFTTLLFLSCKNSSDREKENAIDTASINRTITDEKIATGTKTEKEARLMLMISMSKQAMDSIDFAYSSIRSSSRLMNLSLEEREDVNEALQQMNVAKELIVLETQKEIIDQLRDKTNSLKVVIDHINKTSDRLNNIAGTISKVSGIIEKTTNMLASAFTAGIIKPKIEAGAN